MRDDHRREFRKLVQVLITACGGALATGQDDTADFLRQQAALEAVEAHVDEKAIAFGAFAIQYARDHEGEDMVLWLSPPEA